MGATGDERRNGSDDVDPGEMLALLESERARAQGALDPDPRLIFATWGIAWLLGFSVFWSAAAAASPLDMSMPSASVFFAVCIFSAVVVTMTHVARRVAGVRGVSSTVGAMYGWSWFLAFVTLTAIMLGAVRSGLPDETAGLLWSVLSGLVVGVLYLAGGALWQDKFQFGLGAWILVSSAVGALAGYPSVYLVMAFGGGGGFLLAATYFALHRRGGTDTTTAQALR